MKKSQWGQKLLLVAKTSIVAKNCQNFAKSFQILANVAKICQGLPKVTKRWLTGVPEKVVLKSVKTRTTFQTGATVADCRLPI